MSKGPNHSSITTRERRGILTAPRVLGATILSLVAIAAHEKISDASALHAARTELATLNGPHREVVLSRGEGPDRYPNLFTLASAIVEKNDGHDFELNTQEVTGFLVESLERQMQRDGDLGRDQQLNDLAIPYDQVIEVPDSWGVGERVTPDINSASDD